MPAPLIGIKVLTSANTIRMDSKQSHNATFPSDSFCQTTPLCLIVCAKKKMMHVFKHWKRNRLAGRLTYKEPYYAQRLLSDLVIIDTPPPLSQSYWSSDCRSGDTGSTRTLQCDSWLRKSRKCIQLPLFHDSWTTEHGWEIVLLTEQAHMTFSDTNVRWRYVNWMSSSVKPDLLYR